MIGAWLDARRDREVVRQLRDRHARYIAWAWREIRGLRSYPRGLTGPTTLRSKVERSIAWRTVVERAHLAANLYPAADPFSLPELLILSGAVSTGDPPSIHTFSTSYPHAPYKVRARRRAQHYGDDGI